jgi:hypothetical protein
MPWCPNCKTEYREGITVCADCKATLVAALDETKEKVELCYIQNEAAVAKFMDYLKFQGIGSESRFIPEDNAYAILVDEDDAKKATVEYKAFLSVESSNLAPKEGDEKLKLELDTDENGELRKSIQINSLEDLEKLKAAGVSEEELKQHFATFVKQNTYKPAGVYESQAEKANEYKSTGYTFTIVGVVMLIFTLLNFFGVMKLLYQNYMTLGVLTGLSIASIGVGISSFKRAKKASSNSADEEKLTKELNEWIESHASIFTEGRLAGGDGTSEEILYLDRTAAMKTAIERCFGKLDEDYVDSLVDDFYNKYFAE